MKYTLSFVAGMMLILSYAAQAQSIEPDGLYRNTFSGGVEGAEIVTIRPVTGEDKQYKISNIKGRGFVATIEADGQISIEPFGVVGGFSSPDSALFSLPEGEPRQYQLTRIALTDTHFLDYNDLSFPVNPLYAGDWDGTETVFDMATGNPQPDSPTFVFNTILASDTTFDGKEGLRSTEFVNGVLNGYFQGVLDSQRSYIIQIGDLPPLQTDPTLAMQTLPGSQTSFPVRFIGRGQFEDINTFSNTIVVENRLDDPPAPQIKMTLFKQTLTRREPILAGDFDRDGSIGDSDRSSIMSLYGLDDFHINYNLLADIDNNGIVDLRDIAALDGINTETVSIDASYSGSWFNTSRSGEGWNLAILPENRAIVAFFTYSPDGSTQSWVVGVGEVNDNEIIFKNLQITSGTVFGDEFNKDDVVRTYWGEMRINFSDCNNGAVSYAADGAFDNNARSISRLTNLAGLGCGATPVVNTASQALTGSWFLSSRDGEGIIFEALPNGLIVMYWYTYDQSGGTQYWLSGVGEFDPNTNTAQFDVLNTATGTAFGHNFVSEDVELIPWGEASFVQSDCDTAILNFNASIPGFGSGSYPLIRLTGVDTLICNPDQFSR